MDIRPLSGLAEYHACENLQKAVWEFTEREIVPTHFLLSILSEGSAMLYGAFEKGNRFDSTYIPEQDETLVGWLFGYPVLVPEGESGGKMSFRFYSDMMGVVPPFQSSGIGYRLKLAQRNYSLSLGLDWVVWTYDPLLSKNAHLNIAKLGVVTHTYIENAYGELTGINAGLPTDRFRVDWWLTSRRVARRVSGQEKPPSLSGLLSMGVEVVNPIVWKNDMPYPVEEFSLPESPDRPILVEIPTDFLALKARNMELARAWRFHTRRIFVEAFDKGYECVDYIYTPGNPPRGMYLLEEARRWR